MTLDIRKPLRAALSRLKTERERIDHQIEAIQGVLNLDGDEREAGPRRRARPRRKSMTPAARRAISKRMKEYWSKRRANGTRRKKVA